MLLRYHRIASNIRKSRFGCQYFRKYNNSDRPNVSNGNNSNNHVPNPDEKQAMDHNIHEAHASMKGHAFDSTKKAASAFGNATLHYTHELNKYYADMETILMSRINESNKKRFRFYFFSVIIGFIWISILFGEKIRKEISEKTAGIAKETLENESLKIQTQELAMAVVQTILNDKEIASQAASFLQRASAAPETQAALVQLVVYILQQNDSYEEILKLSKQLIDVLSKDQDVMDHLASLLVSLMEDSRVRAALVKVIEDLSLDNNVITAVSELAVEVFNRKNVAEAANELLAESTQVVMADPQVVSQSRSFVTNVVGDDAIQREGGDALLNSVAHALTPGLARVAGACLLVGSIALAKIFLSPY